MNKLDNNEMNMNDIDLIEPSIEFVECMGNDDTVVNAARVSFGKESNNFTKEQNDKLIGYLAKHKHWSPFAHPQITFRTKFGLPIARQLAKHQVGGVVNECSRRYRDDNIQFENIDIFRTRPKNVKQGSDINSVVENNEEIKELYKNFLKTGEKLYQYFIKCGVCPEQSRYVLPQAMITEWYWTGSLYYFARVCKDRLSPLAQLETRKIAEQISECLQKQFPVSWNALMQNRDKME